MIKLDIQLNRNICQTIYTKSYPNVGVCEGREKFILFIDSRISMNRRSLIDLKSELGWIALDVDLISNSFFCIKK